MVAVTDGDTLKTRCASAPEVKTVRLAEIDAPELKQPWGRRARRSLMTLCLDKRARLDVTGKDRYGRHVARVTCGRRNANAEQVRRGLAWVDHRYAKDKSLTPLEAEARKTRKGLWSNPTPTPPWEWRNGLLGPDRDVQLAAPTATVGWRNGFGEQNEFPGRRTGHHRLGNPEMDFYLK